MYGTLISGAPQNDKAVGLFHLTALLMVESDPKIFVFHIWLSAACGITNVGHPVLLLQLAGEASRAVQGVLGVLILYCTSIDKD